MSQDEKPFSVRDRRHFTPEGQPREDEVDTAQPAPESPQAAAPDATAGDERRPAPGPLTFSQFLLSLGAQAGMLLAGQGRPEGEGAAEALDGARSIISILEMLRDKTEGRRTPDEDQVLDGLLYELRMAYVERRRESKS